MTRDGKLYWVNGQPPEEGKYAVVADSFFTKLLEEAANEFPYLTETDDDSPLEALAIDRHAWFLKWFGDPIVRVNGETNRA